MSGGFRRGTRSMKAAVSLALGAGALALPATAVADRSLFVTNSDTPNSGLVGFNASPSGALSPVTGATRATGEEPHGVVVSPDARNVYVANLDDDTVSAFRLGADGELTANGTAPTGANQPTGLGITPDGGFLFATNRDGTDTSPRVSVFSIDPQSGSLTPTASSPVDLGIFDPRAVAVSPDGRFAYVTGRRGPVGPPASNADRAIAVAAIGGNGSLTPIAGSPFYGGPTNPFGASIAPDGSRLFVTAVTPNQIEVFDLNPNTGVPTAVTNSPFAAGPSPLVLSVAPGGRRLYVGNAGVPESIGGFTIAPATGALSPIAGPVAVNSDPQGIAITPDAGILYSSISRNPGEVVGLQVQTGGSLAALTGSPFASGGVFPNFFSVAVTPTQTPVPALDTELGKVETPSRFDATSTEVRGGFATRFDWDFGDGAVLPNGGPTPEHTYNQGGSYAVTLTVTNDCAPNAVFVNNVASVGNSVYCNGPHTATLTRQVEIVDPVDGSVSARKKQRQKRKVVVKVKVSAREKLTAKATGKVKVNPSYKLKPKTKNVGAGKKKTLKLKPKTKRAQRRIIQALEQGTKPKAKVTVTLTDAAANEKTKKLSVKLKP